ncbi:hypothetical protein [Ammonifex thiophilus]|uniref:Uncharacterized protein n=1 Tax=Ammonifex thiophilus TaxID=444093 RepID=A0A3D8P384_9THEO|nr:hypothetical protein [Ammonifex thiophilus]RDV81222.1 hypothetical protein DXX99_09570 [Ammonifex thiophilus]
MRLSFLALALLAALSCLFVSPALAADGVPAGSRVQFPAAGTRGQSQEQLPTAGDIKPVSPAEVSDRVGNLAEKGYQAVLGVADKVAVLVFGVAGVCALAAFFTGWSFFKKLLAVLAVGSLGLLICYLAPLAVGVLKAIALHFK